MDNRLVKGQSNERERLKMIIDNRTWGSIWIVIWSILLIIDYLLIPDVYLKVFFMSWSGIFIVINIYYAFGRENK